MKKELIERLKKLASRNCWMDDEEFNPCDFSGGNYDDAYSGGFEDGMASIAREILSEIEKGDL